MGRGGEGSKGLRVCKVFLVSLVVFTILLVIIGLLLRFTPLPESYSHLYVLLALWIVSFVIGLLAGSVTGKRGMLFGGLSAVAFLLIIIILTVLITGQYAEAGVMRFKFLPCLILGCIGGMIGVNIRTS